MGFPWRKVIDIAAGVGGAFNPAIGAAVHTVEENLPGLAGPDKKTAAISIAQSVILATESTLQKDVVNDPEVVAATGAAIDAYVAAMNTQAALREAIEHAKHAKAQPVL